MAVETGGSNDAGPAWRRLGRKGFFHVAGVRSWSDGSSDDPLSKAGDGEGDEENREGDEDDGADGDVDDADDGLAVAVDEEGDGIDFMSQGSHEDDLKAVPVHGGTLNGLSISAVPPVNGTGTVQDRAAVLLRNATGGAADAHGTVQTLSGSASALNNISSVGVASLRDRGTPAYVANSFAVGPPGAEKPISTDKSGHGIST